MATTRYTTINKCQCGAFTSELVSDDIVREAQLAYAFPATRPAPAGAFHIAKMGDFALWCRGCGKSRVAKPVRGRFNAAVACNAKCQSSHGHQCECSCGGKNHGAAC